MKTTTIALLLLLCTAFVYGQEEPVKKYFIGLEGGITSIQSEMPDVDFIRGEIPLYSSGYSINSLTSLTHRSFMGIKTEVITANNKFGISGGLRYSRMTSSIGKDTYWGSGTDFFYWLYDQNGVNTEYMKVKEVVHTYDYVGIPLEIRFFPFRPRLFRVYFKVGAEFNYRINEETDIVFHNTSMEPYQEALASGIKHPNAFSSALYGAAGIRMGREGKPTVSFEVCAPYVFITSETSTLVKQTAGAGVQLNIQIPVNLIIK